MELLYQLSYIGMNCKRFFCLLACGPKAGD